MTEHAQDRGQAQPHSSTGGKDRPARWAQLGGEFGLYTIAELAERLRFDSAENLRARQLTGKARVLAIADNGAVLYPAFQFDEAEARMVPVVKDIVRQGRAAGWTDEELVLWFCRANQRLAGKRPVDVLADEERIMTAAAGDLQAASSAAG